MQTRFAFLGLVLGTIPLFYKEVKKHGFNNKYYIVILISAIIGITIFNINKELFPNPKEFVDNLHKDNVHLCLNINPVSGIYETEENFAKFKNDAGII